MIFNKIREFQLYQQLYIQMSEHMQHSDSNSMDQNIQIHPNNQGENEIYIPYWEQEGSSSTQLNHLMEEVRILKNKCKHLQNHLEENHRQFSSLNQLYLISQANQRKLYKQNEELRKRHREINNELLHCRTELDSSIAELNTAGKREADLRERLMNCNQRQTQILGRLELLQQQNNSLKRMNNPSQKNFVSEEDKWKKFYSQQITQIEGKWRAAYEELELQFDKKAREFRQKADELKNLNKTYLNMREEYQQKIKGLEGEIQDLKRQLNRYKGTSAETQRQLKDLRQVLEDVSTKNDDIQRQNAKLRTKVSEESNRTQKLIKQNSQLNSSLIELKRQLKQMEREIEALNKSLNQMKIQEASLERVNGEAKIEIQKLSMNNSYLESLILNLREQLESLKRKKQIQIQEIMNNYKSKFQQQNTSHEEQKNKLINKIALCQQQLTGLRKKLAQLKGELQKNNNDNQDSEQLLRIRDQALRFKQEVTGWKNKLQVANRKIKDLEDQSFSNKDCGHSEQIKKLNSQLQKSNSLVEDLKSKILMEKQNILSLQSKLKEYSNKIAAQKSQMQNINRNKHQIQQECQLMKEEKVKLNGQIKRLNLQLEELKKRINNKMISQSDDRYRSLEFKLRDQNLHIRQLQENLQIKQRQRLRLEEENGLLKEGEREKYRKMELKVIEKQKAIQDSHDKIDQLESQIGDLKQKIKIQEREIRNKEIQISKRDKNIKQNQKDIQNLTLSAENYQKQTQKLKIEIDLLRKQIKSDQHSLDKLKQEIIKNSQDQKQNMHHNNTERNSEQWEEKNKNYLAQVKLKDSNIAEMKKQINSLKNHLESINKQYISTQTTLKEQIRALELQIKLKNQIIQKLKPASDQEAGVGGESLSTTLSDLQAQYNRELVALKRLIMYKGQREDQGRRYQELKSDYQQKINLFLIDYKSMQQEMMILKEQVLAQPVPSPSVIMPIVNVEQIQNIWRIRLQQICGERQILIQKVGLWQRRYEELKYLFEAKLQSKEETINLLNLKLNNLQLSKQSTYTCSCPFNYGHR